MSQSREKPNDDDLEARAEPDPQPDTEDDDDNADADDFFLTLTMFVQKSLVSTLHSLANQHLSGRHIIHVKLEDESGQLIQLIVPVGENLAPITDTLKENTVDFNVTPCMLVAVQPDESQTIG